MSAPHNSDSTEMPFRLNARARVLPVNVARGPRSRQFTRADFLAWCLWVRDGCPADALDRYRREVALQVQYTGGGGFFLCGETARRRTRARGAASHRRLPPVP